MLFVRQVLVDPVEVGEIAIRGDLIAPIMLLQPAKTILDYGCLWV